MYAFPTMATNSESIDLNAAGYIAQEGQTAAGQKSISTFYNSLEELNLRNKSTQEAIDDAVDHFFSNQRQFISAIYTNVFGITPYNFKFEVTFKPE